MLAVAVTCMVIAAWPCQAQEADYGETVGTGAVDDPILDGFGPFPTVVRCPEVPHESQDCVPGMWYFGSLFGDTAFDLTIEDAAGHTKYRTLYAEESELRERIETGTGIQIDALQQKVEKAELRAYRAEKGMPILFGVGVGIGVAVTVLIVALVDNAQDEPATMEPALTLRW